MNRLFGSSKGGPTTPSLPNAISQTDSRVDSIQVKICKLDAELFRYKEQLAKLPDTAASKSILKQRAVNVLKQKKMYETQRDQLMQQSFNMEQANYAVESLQGTSATVSAMSVANKELGKQIKRMDMRNIEKVQDSLAELMEDASEIQLVMSRSYGLPETLDEESLEAELEALGEELMVDDEEEPSYLLDSLPAASPTLNASPATASRERPELK